MSGGQSRSQAEAKRWAEASADDPVENRRGRPRTRLDHPSDLLDRVKTGGEIRSYIRKKTNNVPVRYDSARENDTTIMFWVGGKCPAYRVVLLEPADRIKVCDRVERIHNPLRIT